MWKQKESADDYVTSHTKTPKLPVDEEEPADIDEARSSSRSYMIYELLLHWTCFYMFSFFSTTVKADDMGGNDLERRIRVH